MVTTPIDTFRSEAPAYEPAAVLLLDDDVAQRVAGLWRGVSTGWDGTGETWDEAWDEVDLASACRVLAEASGIRASIVEQKLRMLVHARLIYPDGTLAAVTAQVLRDRLVEQRLGAARAVEAARRAKP